MHSVGHVQFATEWGLNNPWFPVAVYSMLPSCILGVEIATFL